MDYSKIKLANERNEHVTKRLNRLTTWKFFKVIYRENIWRMFGFNFLMLLFIVPIFLVMTIGNFNLSQIQHNLPMNNGIGFSTGAWFAGSGDMGTVNMYLAAQTRQNHTFYGGMMAVAGVLLTLIFSGGFAVIRDAFWTGKLSAVGVFKSMWLGIKSNILYAFVSSVIVSGSVYGIYELFVYLNEVAGMLWLAIVAAVLLSIVALFVAMYLMILCSVSVTYKQSVKDNIDDAWRLLWLNVLPNIVHLILAVIPIAFYLLLTGNMLGQLLMILMLMFGGLYFPLVWQTHMMKTFALFHPVEVKKKKQLKAERAEETRAAESEPSPSEQPTNAPRQPKSRTPKVKKAQYVAQADPDRDDAEQPAEADSSEGQDDVE